MYVGAGAAFRGGDRQLAQAAANNDTDQRQVQKPAEGIIEPRVAVKGKKKPRRVSYTHGDRADKAEAGMAELRAMQGKE